MVRQIDRFRPQLDPVAGGEVEPAHEGLIPLPESGAAEHVVRRVAQSPGRRLAERRDVVVTGQPAVIAVRVDARHHVRALRRRVVCEPVEGRVAARQNVHG